MKTHIFLLPIFVLLALSGAPIILVNYFFGSASAAWNRPSSDGGTYHRDAATGTSGGSSGGGCASFGGSSFGEDRAISPINYNVGDHHPNWPHVVKASNGTWLPEYGYLWLVDADAPYDMRVKVDPRVAALRQQEALSRVNTQIVGSRRKLLEFQARRFHYQEQTRRTLDSTYVPQPPAVMENWQASFWQRYGISDAFETAKRNLETFRTYVMDEGIREAFWYTLSGALKEAGYEHVDTFVSIERNITSRQVSVGEYWKRVNEANAYLPPRAYGRIEERSRENLCGYARDVYVELYPLPDGLDSARRFVPSPLSCR
jgi:hypothetical protein